MSDLEQRVKELETKVKILEESLETLKNMQLSEEMEEYIQLKTKSLKLVNLMNAVSDEPAFDFSKEEKSVQNIRATKNAIDEQIKVALRNTTNFSEEYPNDPRYFNYEVESGIAVDNDAKQILLQWVGNGIRIISYNGFDSDRVIVPAQIDGQPVISIGEKAFQNANFSEIILPNSVKVILASAFQGCTNLRHIDLPEGLKYLGTFCFFKTGLTSITIPESVKKISRGCFGFCENLENVVLGNKIRKLEESAFTWCKKLKQINLSETLKEIDSDCFENTQIKILIIPSSVQKISNQIFGDSSTLRYSNDITCAFLGKSTVTKFLNRGFNRVKQIYCLPGSAIQKYAREHSIAIKPLSEFNVDEI